ncbi:hypothetical protein LP032_114 [Listeria phage LP-032]|uniref:Uncharacterized protein n=2 Tax=Homburgvirus LP26 TaxID=1921126 RepID=A0A059TA12_9CAUD|nr:hypothetical protein LP026_051 [Listeria phage LP-026]AHL18963.1 hypothetical protein LP032_114 [Listeria phage LP-032]AHN84745.1 hypothetical protein LP026_051 [Listeria phage LP-026]
MLEMENKLQEKHLKNGFINPDMVNQNESYYIQSKPSIYGGCLVYQFITMKDGIIYELESNTASTYGIVARFCFADKVLQREIKNRTRKSGVIKY